MLSLLRSLLFTAPLIALATVVMGTISIVTGPFDRSGALQHRLACIWSRMLLAICFIRIRVDGLEKLDPHVNYVFVANHASYMDIPVLLLSLPYQIRFFAKKGLFSIPFMGSHLKRAGHLPVDRSSARASLKSMSEGARLVAQHGLSVLLFPEGGRVPQGLREFKEGAAYIAIKAGVPIVPVALSGMREILPMDSLTLRGGTALLRIGDPIPTASMSARDRETLTERLYQEVSNLLAPVAQTIG